MTFKGTLFSASYVVRRLAKHYDVSPLYVWGIFAEKCNVCKGNGCQVTKEQISKVEIHICEEIMKGSI